MAAGLRSPRGYVCLAFAVAITFLSVRPSAQSGLLDDGLSRPPPPVGSLAYNTFVPLPAPGTNYPDQVSTRRSSALPQIIRLTISTPGNMLWNANEPRYLHRNSDDTAYADYLAVIAPNSLPSHDPNYQSRRRFNAKR